LRRDEVAGGCGKLHNEEVHSLYSSPNIIRTIKSRRIGWAGHVASMDRREFCTKFLLESLRGRDHSKDVDVDGSILLKWILGK
jgi:hypothetical protein